MKVRSLLKTQKMRSVTVQSLMAAVKRGRVAAHCCLLPGQGTHLGYLPATSGFVVSVSADLAYLILQVRQPKWPGWVVVMAGWEPAFLRLGLAFLFLVHIGISHTGVCGIQDPWEYFPLKNVSVFNRHLTNPMLPPATSGMSEVSQA